jgi:toxin CcdB
MARFDLHALPGGGRVPYVVVVQATLLDDLASRVVVPLVPLPQFERQRVGDLHPVLVIGEGRYLLYTHEIAPMPLSELGRPVGNLAGFQDEITRALDILLTGF